MIVGSNRATNLGLLFVLVLSCGQVFDTTAQVIPGSTTANSVAGDVGNSSTVDAPSASDVPLAPTPALECPINCANGAECKLGEHDFDFFPREVNGAPFAFLQTISREGWYCDCPAGFTGLRCNRQYEICPLSLNMTSSKDAHFCFHGGSCLEGLTDGTHESIADFQRFCDCKDATHNGTPYYGKYCEIEGAIQCSDDSDEYCTAQGQCKEDFASKFTPCECREGHRGPHCEFMRGSVPECTLTCGASDDTDEGTEATPHFGGVGQCRLGIKKFENARYEDFWSEHDGNYQYCECSDGWFGDDCEIPGVECGNSHCFNGGGCLETLNQNGQTTYACDCRDAGHLGKSWAGQYCENSATTECQPGPLAEKLQHANGDLFCTNGGTCKDPNNPYLGCDCPEGQYGPSCEFQSEEDAKCNLKCQNGGQCRSGTKDNSLIEQLGKGLDGYNDTHHSELFEHCVCPHNYFGIQCEHKLEICPGGDHVCLHGSKCVAKNEGSTDGELYYMCDCDSAFDSLEKYAGKFCQYSSTDICTKNGQPGMGKANFAFCVNNGICKGRVEDGEDPPGCTCPEGFYGDHCEYLEEEKEEDEGKFDGGVVDSDVEVLDDDYQTPPISKPRPAVTKPSPVVVASAAAEEQKSKGPNKVVLGLSLAIVATVVIFVGVIVRALFKGPSADDIKGALSEEDTSSEAPSSTSGIVQSGSGDGSLEDIEVDDYVNNHSNILTDQEMTNVQIV